MEDAKFFNFPIKMFQCPFYVDNLMQNIIDYHLVSYADNLTNFSGNDGDKDYRINAAAKFFNVNIGSIHRLKKNGNELIRNFATAKVFTGINTDIFWDYYENRNSKTTFEWQCLLAFLSLKSILGHKKHAKTNNTLLYARMTGHENTEPYLNSDRLIITRYQRDKIFDELQDKWNLVYYSNHTKGFYFSFSNKISFEDLVFEAEKARKSSREKQRKNEKQAAILKAKERLEISAH